MKRFILICFYMYTSSFNAARAEDENVFEKSLFNFIDNYHNTKKYYGKTLAFWVHKDIYAKICNKTVNYKNIIIKIISDDSLEKFPFVINVGVDTISKSKIQFIYTDTYVNNNTYQIEIGSSYINSFECLKKR